MKYFGVPDFPHQGIQKVGILLVNLGTPAAPEPSAVRRYLKQFLSDPRVIEVPKLIWWPILHGVILPLRGKRSAHAYQSVWQADGSPLMVLSKQLSEALRKELDQRYPERVALELAMRYGEPSVASGLRSLQAQGARRILVLPLYPQYSATTTASVFDAVSDELKTWRMLPELRFLPHYYQQPSYTHALADSVQQHWQAGGRAEHLLVSMHGIPERYARAGDPYLCHSHGTFQRLSAALGLDANSASLSFQSRVGRERWLGPYTDARITALARAGIKTLDVICPGFAVDCLETLEEIKVENRARFLQAGGRELRYIPALNASAAHVQLLTELIASHTGGWPELDLAFSPELQAKLRADHYLSAKSARAAESVD
jgi:ferrochelatase